MTIQIELSSEEETVLKMRADLHGERLTDYVARIVRRDIDSSAKLERILGPFRDQVEASGISDDDLDSLLANTRASASQERRKHTS